MKIKLVNIDIVKAVPFKIKKGIYISEADGALHFRGNESVLRVATYNRRETDANTMITNDYAMIELFECQSALV